MFRAGPPSSAAPGAPPRVSGAWRRAFTGSSPAAADPLLREYLSDMLAPYRAGLREDLLAAGAGQSYGEMAGALLAEATAGATAAGLLVFAFAVADVIPGRSVAAHLSHRCPGRPMAFAVCDQGAVAAFTGVQAIRQYLAGGCGEALLVVAEQSAVPYELAGPAAIPQRDAVVVVRFGANGPARLLPVRQRTAVPAVDAAGALASEVAASAGDHPEVTLVAGNGLTGALNELDGTVRVIAAPAGQPSTGIWWELAGRLAGWAASRRRVLLADYDPVLGYLCVCGLELSPGCGRAGG